MRVVLFLTLCVLAALAEAEAVAEEGAGAAEAVVTDFGDAGDFAFLGAAAGLAAATLALPAAGAGAVGVVFVGALRGAFLAAVKGVLAALLDFWAGDGFAARVAEEGVRAVRGWRV